MVERLGEPALAEGRTGRRLRWIQERPWQKVPEKLLEESAGGGERRSSHAGEFWKFGKFRKREERE